MKQKIKPNLLGGFQDCLPEKMIALQEVIQTVKTVYESFGFVPLDTPGMERFDVLMGEGQGFNKSIFVSKIMRGAEDKAIEMETDGGLEGAYTSRFDLTVPLARVIAAYPELPKPFKRYQIGKVWRGERPQHGRFREFTQFDIDIVGSKSIMSDVEIMSVMFTTLQTLDIDTFVIKVNDRRILNGLAEIIGCAEKIKELYRVIDKVESLGIEGVISELLQPPTTETASKITLNEGQAETVKEFLAISAGDPSQIIEKIQNLFEGKTSQGVAGIEALKALTGYLPTLSIPAKYVRIDLSVARGLDYYTGLVFETNLTDFPELGSVFSGGRYDGLVDRFITDSNIPAVGASIGIDRLMIAMLKMKKLSERSSLTEVVVSIFDPSLQDESLKIASEIRKNGFNTELYLGDDRTFKSQLVHTVKRGIRFLVIAGPDEIKAGKVMLKDLDKKTQEILTLSDLCQRLKDSLR